MDVLHDEARYPVICKLARPHADDKGGFKFACASFALSQFDEGARLLRLANRHQCRFIADAAYLDRQGLLATFSIAYRLIRFHPDRSVPELMVDLTHETRHLETRMAGIMLNGSMTHARALKFHRANETMSSTAEAMIVAEAALMGERLNMPYDLCEVFRREQPNMAQAFARALPLAKAGNWPGFAADMFTAVYQDPSTIADHARDVARCLMRATPRSRFSDDGPAHEYLSNRLIVKGQRFLRIEDCDLDHLPLVQQSNAAPRLQSLLSAQSPEYRFHAKPEQ